MTSRSQSMERLYERAARLTAPKMASETPGLTVEGYWLNSSEYFFQHEKFDPSLGRIVNVPSIADAETGAVVEIISFEDLAGLVSPEPGQLTDRAALSLAEFDMPDRDTLAVFTGEQDLLIDARRKRVIQQAQSMSLPALYSPDNRFACFVNGANLWLRERVTGTERALTTDGGPHYCYGQESETCLATLIYRQRPYPLGLWSPDSQWFLTQRIDERALPDFSLIQHAPPSGDRPILHSLKYSMPGDLLPVATYVAIHVPSGRVVSFDEFPGSNPTLSTFFLRTVWFSDYQTAWFVRSDRHARKLELVQLDLARGQARIVITETIESGYLDLHPCAFGIPNVRTLAKSGEVIWFSERDGWGHLYLHDAASGVMKNQITRGEWLVRDIVHVDEDRRRIFFLAGGLDPKADPARRSLCVANLDSTGFEVLISADADVYVPLTDPCGLDRNRPFRPAAANAGMSPDGRLAVIRYASAESGNRTEITNLRSLHSTSIASVVPDTNGGGSRHFTALAADGVTPLYGVLFLPPGFDPESRYPLIDYIYPGPHLAHQPQSFRSVNSALASTLAELGFATIMLDTRATPTRSRSFHQVGYPALQEPQLADHAAVVQHLCQQFPFLDETRIGMIGYSAGGGATMRALCDYGDVFRVGVAVAGVNDPSLLMSAWTDKYRGPIAGGTVAEQPNSAAAAKLKGKLLLITGDLDENVHVAHTLTMVDALVHANKDFDVIIVPNERHYLLMTSGYVQRRIWDYFVTNLLGEAPPRNFELSFEPHELARFWKNLFRDFRQSL
jgi:dienelactone hydrolase